jgi:hypothetical protein
MILSDLNRQSGAAFIEFTVGALFFFTLIFSSISFIWTAHRLSFLQYSTALGVRDGVVEFYRNNNTSGSPDVSIKNSIVKEAANYGIRVDPNNIEFCVLSTTACAATTLLPRSSYFITRVKIEPDGLIRFLNGLKIANVRNLSATALGVNSKPVSVLR